MKKRLITVFTAAVLILSLFAGACGKKELTAVRVGSLKGPTTMGIVNMMSEAEAGTTAGKYEFTMETDPSVLAAGMINGNYDIVMVPANMAAILYNKTEGGVKVLDINTGGVLEVLSGRDDIDEIEDLAGQKVVLTGQGATPEYALRYLLDQYGIEDAKLEFHPEATEVAAVLAEDPQQIAVLPEPFATVCQKSNENVRSVFTLSDAWAGLGDDVNGGSRLLTGVTVVNAAFAESNKEELKAFMNDHEASAAKAASGSCPDAKDVRLSYGKGCFRRGWNRRFSGFIRHYRKGTCCKGCSSLLRHQLCGRNRYENAAFRISEGAL